MDLKGKVAVVTGSSSGCGAVIAAALDLPLVQGYVGLTLAIPVFLTALVAVACGLLFVLAAALGVSMDSRVGYTLSIAPLVALALWGLKAGIAWLARLPPPGSVVSLREVAARGLGAEDVGGKAHHLALLAARGARVAPGWDAGP